MEKVQAVKEEKANIRMALIGSIEHYLPGDDFEAYEDRLNQFFKVNKVDEETKVPLFITVMGGEAYKILKSLIIPATPSNKTFEELIAVLKKHFSPVTNKRAERFKFSKAKQEQGEHVADFIIKLKALAQTCDFGEFLDDALSDKFIVGLQRESVQQALLRKENLNFNGYCEIALSMEMSEKEVHNINPLSNNLNSLKSETARCSRNRSPGRYIQGQKKKTHGRSNERRQPRGCPRCGGSHDESRCSAEHWQCFICHRYGHTSTVCYKNKFKNDGVRVINSVNIRSQPAICAVLVEDEEINFEVDTGACATIIDLVKYNKKFKHLNINSSNDDFCSVTGQSIRVIGSIQVRVEFRGKNFILKMYVIDAENFVNPLLGRAWLDELIPCWRDNIFNINASKIHLIESTQENNSQLRFLEQIKNSFPNIISDRSDQMISGYTVEIQLEENVIPIFHKAYVVPFKLRDKVENEINRLCSLNILEPVKYSKWASPIVIVPKANGDIRICIDCKVTINKFIKTEHYPLPRIDDIFAGLSNCKNFCVIDLTGAYQQVCISENSREYLTINTHKGLYRYTRLPFGVASAPSIFQSIMDRVLLNNNKVACYLDDIIVGGETKEETVKNVMTVLNRLNEKNIKINLNKSKFLETKVHYLGHILSDGKISPKPEKVKAIVEAPIPIDKTQLQSYLGLLNYYGRFIPNLSGELKDLYKLLRKDVAFEWTDACQLGFDKSKNLLQENKILELYDPSKPIVIATDASPYGVGGILSHVIDGVEKPVLFVSSSLSPAEKNFSQLHREALAIIFSLKKFHKYIYGHEFTICTDHQALRTILDPKKNTPAVAAARLQRWAVILSMYRYKIEYRKGSQMAHADALSRLPKV